MSFDLASYEPRGDKKNSDFFNEYLPKIYERRARSGVAQQVGPMRAVVLQVETDVLFDTLVELYVMSPYRHTASYLGRTHKYSVLHSHLDYPALIVMAPLSPTFEDFIPRINRMYPLARNTPQTRYVGEVFGATDLNTLTKTLEDQNIRFEYSGDTENPFYRLKGLRFTTPSDFTCNRVGYSTLDFNDTDSLGLGDRVLLSSAEQARLDEAAAFGADSNISSLMLGIDHLATRVLAGEREDAILEFLTMVPYYFWGAYNIFDMNSSTNVNRNAGVDDDKKSPAKVFTANNTPSFVNSFAKRPMPTEDFVRNFGRRLHHMAIEILDGDHGAGEKNVDFVVNTLKDQGVPFLAHVVGECKDDPNLKQIFSKHSKNTLLITEYIERCHKYDGFFTKDNVAALTAAAGQDEQYQHGHVFD
ncbi:hypothetical protein [Ruegeria faecimaris]|uniref:hypothetical protein n=1 Tax=Ruegeria faecimaris TaxID=686389 RepID=UPI00248FF7F1|nr:hypothetical protein [Ruegeria faecimaris]